MNEKSKSELIIIGGANGSGKTTFAREIVAEIGIEYLGADEIAGQMAFSFQCRDSFEQTAARGDKGVIILDEARAQMMAESGRKLNGTVSDETLREMIEFQRIGNRAIHKAQEENRRLGIPNWYSIGGKIVSDLESSHNTAPKNSAESDDAAPKD